MTVDRQHSLVVRILVSALSLNESLDVLSLLPHHTVLSMCVFSVCRVWRVHYHDPMLDNRRFREVSWISCFLSSVLDNASSLSLIYVVSLMACFVPEMVTFCYMNFRIIRIALQKLNTIMVWLCCRLRGLQMTLT